MTTWGLGMFIVAICKKIVIPEWFYRESMFLKLLEPGFRLKACRNDIFFDFYKKLNY